jgi:hypothetical protein
MSDVQWRITAYDLDRDGQYSVPAEATTFVYAAQGKASVSGHGSEQVVEMGEGLFAGLGARIASTGNAWLFEIGPIGTEIRVDHGVSPVISRIARIDKGVYIIRADRVESQAGARTPAHRHRGPGVRRLERGVLRAEVGDHLDRIAAGGAWFETGQERVVGTNISGGANVFVRVMLLPAELMGGKSSFIPMTPADAAKPRPVNLRLFGEHDLR